MTRTAFLNIPGITAEFLRAADESVDDEIAIYVEGEAEAVAGIQVCGFSYWANCWTSKARDEMEHAPHERAKVSDACTDVVALLRKHKWIG